MKKNIFAGSFAILALVSLGACQKSEPAESLMECVPDSAIVGGSEVGENDPLAKKVVLLLTRADNGLKICSGTPIAKDVILTAAHCVKGSDKNNINVVFRTKGSCSSGFKLSKESVKVKDYIAHAGYQAVDKAINDIALIKLQSSIPSNYEISEIYDGKGELSNNDVVLTGYGLNDEGNKSSLSILRTTTKNYKDEKEFEIEGNHIFFLQRWSGICGGDSGGPVFFEVGGKLKVAGVNSIVAGDTKATICHGVGVSMYVPSYMDWIQTQSANLN